MAIPKFGGPPAKAEDLTPPPVTAFPAVAKAKVAKITLKGRRAGSWSPLGGSAGDLSGYQVPQTPTGTPPLPSAVSPPVRGMTGFDFSSLASLAAAARGRVGRR